MIGEIHNHHNPEVKSQVCQEYVEALEEERRKIMVFQRELPLCLDLVTRAIETCKQQLSGSPTPQCFQGQSECSEQTSSEMPVLEEFMPVKRNSSCDGEDEGEEEEEEEEDESENPIKNHSYKSNDKSSKKSDWLKSVQLWNQTPDLPPIEESSPRKASVIEVKRNGNGGAFHPFKKEKSGGSGTSPATTSPCSVPVATGSSSTETAGGSRSGGGGGGSGNKEDKEGLSQRKARRCWSPELHRRFLNALQQLGGSHVATPKQIRELMKVDGLTNDEVKSHLQKYRLHTRRPTPSMHNDNNPQQQPQFVVVGGIWVPPPEYAAVAAATPTPLPREESSVAAPKSIYAPIAAPPPPPPAPQPAKSRSTSRQQCKQLDSNERAGRSLDRVVRCNSSATSSSTRTSKASLAF